MPESLPPDKRDHRINLARLNPLTQLLRVLNIQELRLLLAGIFLWAFAFAMLQSNLSFLTKDRFGWQPDDVNALFFVVGLVGILTQGVLIGRLLPRFGEAKLAMGGMLSMAVGLVLIAVVTATGTTPLLFLAIIFIAFGNGLITPSTNGLLSQAVSLQEQGRVQGGNQSVQALGRVVGPLWGGWSYEKIGPAVPYLSASIGMLAGMGMIGAAIPVLRAHKAKMAELHGPVR
jgi:DHA1 family tetracycline resistance protein-like MFS transporter